MRIDEQIQTPDSAFRAPEKQAAGLFAGFGELFSVLAPSSEGSGPEGIKAAVSREMNDPLGLATARAAVDSGGPGAVSADATARANSPAPAAQNETANTDPQQSRLAQKAGSPEPRPGAEPSDPRNSKQTSNGSPQGNETQSAGRGQASSAAGAPGVGGATQQVTVEATSGAQGVRAIGSAGASGAGQAGGGGGSAAGSSQGIGAIPGGAGGHEKLAQLGKAGVARPPQMLRGQEAEVGNQIAKGLASLVLKDGGRAIIQLRPEALGRVDVDLTIKDGVVSATMSAENETARDLLSSELDRLRALLEKRGLRVEKLEISDGAGERDARAEPVDGRGGRGKPAQDEPLGFGTDADGRSPWSGGHDRAQGGGLGRRVDRGGLDEHVDTAEPGVALDGDGDGVIDRRRPAALLVRLDTVA